MSDLGAVQRAQYNAEQARLACERDRRRQAEINRKAIERRPAPEILAYNQSLPLLLKIEAQAKYYRDVRGVFTPPSDHDRRMAEADVYAELGRFAESAQAMNRSE